MRKSTRARSRWFGATLLACAALQGGDGSAFAAGADPGAATPIQREQAQARFARGRELYGAKKFEPALGEFRASLEIVASPNTRLYLARCLRELGRLVESYAEFGRTSVDASEHARDDPRYAKAGQSASDERAALAPRLGFVTVTVEHATDATNLTVGGEEVKRAAWTEPAPVMPGTTEIVVETKGLPPVRREVTVAAGESQSMAIDAGMAPEVSTPVAAAAPPTEPVGTSEGTKLLPYVILSGGIGVAGMVTFAVAGSMANSTYDRLESECHGPCPAWRAGDVSAGRTQQTIANVGLAVGLVGLAGAATLFVVSLSRQGPAKSAIVVGPAWVGLRGEL